MIKRFMPRGLWSRTLLILVLPVFILQGLGVYLFYERHWDKLAQRLATSTAGDIALISEWHEQDVSFLNPAQRVRLLRYTGLDAQVGLDEEASKTDNLATYKHFNSALVRALDGRSFAVYHGDEDEFHVIVETARGMISLDVPVKRLYSSTTYIFVLWLVFLTLVLLGSATLLLRRQMKPILRLAKASMRENLDLKLEGADEVRQATAAFLDMQDQIKRDDAQRGEILTTVRKDLQQPLDRLRLTLKETLKDHPDAPDMLGDVKLMERMIDGYLSYARDNQDEPLRFKNLRELVREAHDLSGANKVSMKQDNTRDVKLSVRPMAVKRALANILRNAQNRDASLMVVNARNIQTDDGKMVLIALEDNGQKLSDKEIALIRNPISAKLHKKSQTDLGLTVAIDIIESHHGIMTLSQGVKGMRVSIMMPS